MSKENIAEKILGNLIEAIDLLERSREFACLMPEVRVNIAYALPGAKSKEEVAAVDGRITVVRGHPRAAGLSRWGASDHMARLIIEVRKYVPSINAGINFKCDEQIIAIVKKYASEKRISYGWIDRNAEPEEVALRDGNSMPWKIEQLIKRCGTIPLLFYEGEGWGKEPLFVALGDSATQVVKTAIEIARKYKKR